MDRRLRSVCETLEKATLQARDATRSAELALERVVRPGTMLANKPIPVVGGVELPQTIHFVGDTAK